MPTLTNVNLPYYADLDPASADLWGTPVINIMVALDSELATKTFNQNFADFVLSRPELKDYSETVNALGNITGTLSAGAIDYTLGQVVTATLTGNVTIANDSIANWPASGKSGSIMLRLTQGGSGGYTITLGSAFKKAGGTLTLSTAIAARDRVFLVTEDAGTTIDATIATGFA